MVDQSEWAETEVIGIAQHNPRDGFANLEWAVSECLAFH